jgi:hypothetical protein
MNINPENILEISSKYKNIAYLCESFEHLPIAIGLIKMFPKLKIISTSDYIINYLRLIGIIGLKINLTDINSCNNLTSFIRGIFKLKAESKEILQFIKNTYLLTSSARVSVSLFKIFYLRTRDIAFLAWEGVDWKNGRKFVGKPKILSWKSYVVLLLRQFLYRLFVCPKICLREFSGEIFLTYSENFDYHLHVTDKEEWISGYKKFAETENNEINNKIIYLLGQSYLSDCVAFGRERVDAIFDVLRHYKDSIVFKTHPGSNRFKYFNNNINDAYEFYDKDIPIEILANSSTLIISLGSTGLVNTSNLGIDSICVGRIRNYPAGNLGDNFFKEILKVDTPHYKELARLDELRSIIECFCKKKI